jgi:hypothetical protein
LAWPRSERIGNGCGSSKVVRVMSIESVWVFHGSRATFASGVFTSRAAAEAWIARVQASGTLTRYPLDISVYDWAVERGYFEPTKAQHRAPEFIQGFSCASLEHEHYEDGRRPGGDGEDGGGRGQSGPAGI